MRFLAAPHGIALAHVTRALEVAKALRARGHDVIFACSGRYGRILEREGFEHCPVITETPEKALARVRQGKRYADDDRMLAAYVEDECRVMREVGPDAVLGDLRPTLGISTELMQLPYIAITNACFTRYYAAAHPPPETVPLTRWLGKRLSARLMPGLRKMMLSRMAAPFRRYREEHDLAPVATMMEVLESPVMNLIADVPEFAPTRNLPGHFRYVGPLVWNPTLPVPPWLERLPEGRRKVYVTLGSTGGGRPVTEAIIRALSTLDVEVMIVGDCPAVDDRRRARFHWAPYAPGRILAERADLVICHGGSGTIYQALSAGRPLLCLPTFVEQEIHADRVVACGVGLKICPSRISPRTVRAACEELLDNPRYTEAALDMKNIVSEWDGPATAASLIEIVTRGHGYARPGRSAATPPMVESAHD